MAGGSEQSGDGWEQSEQWKTLCSDKLLCIKKILEGTLNSLLHRKIKQWKPFVKTNHCASEKNIAIKKYERQHSTISYMDSLNNGTPLVETDYFAVRKRNEKQHSTVRFTNSLNKGTPFLYFAVGKLHCVSLPIFSGLSRFF